MNDLIGKVALVTGAGSGIGKASALALAKAGAAVAVMSRTAKEIRATAAEIEAAGGKALAVTGDVSSEADMAAAIKAIISGFGRLDIVVANAGINGVWAPIEDLKPKEWDQTIGINLRGTYMTLHLAIPHLKRAGGGAIVVVSSINGNRTFTTPGASAYAATKAAQVAMVQQLALELGDDGIRINAVCPGAIETQIDDNTDKRRSKAAEVPAVFPEGDVPITGGEPGRREDVAELVLFLCGNGSRHITGTPVYIDGGQSLLR
ncbi:SDR family NAD(P)-dependent oxidoreductase [Devosia sp.]|uniref:SDR family oxidoreductase n=1 Tax=Devosia sp. TaxID=1871048 RepID=UPI003265558D